MQPWVVLARRLQYIVLTWEEQKQIADRDSATECLVVNGNTLRCVQVQQLALRNQQYRGLFRREKYVAIDLKMVTTGTSSAQRDCRYINKFCVLFVVHQANRIAT